MIMNKPVLMTEIGIQYAHVYSIRLCYGSPGPMCPRMHRLTQHGRTLTGDGLAVGPARAFLSSS